LEKIIEEFRANAGRVGGYFEGAPMILIHHIGARSGMERVNPPTYLPDGNDIVITATKSGAPTNPDWYYNLKEHPRITVEVGTATFPVEATEVTGEERDELWRRLVEMRPGFAEYETKTSRILGCSLRAGAVPGPATSSGRLNLLLPTGEVRLWTMAASRWR
jgi:deazaflavin-dependent oxidoreductase (nitroreductase family)